MRWLAIVAVVVATVAAVEAKPRRIDDLEIWDPGQPTCDRAKSWPKLRTCLQRGGNRVQVLYDLDGAKLVTVAASTAADTSSLALFLLRDGTWQKANVYASLGPTNEVLSFKRLAKSNGYRLEVGTIASSTTTMAENWIRKVTIRRIISTVCLDATGYCRGMFTRCDALIDGKSYWSYRGELVIHNGAVRMSGDASRAGTVCAPPRSSVSKDLVGDPLE